MRQVVCYLVLVSLLVGLPGVVGCGEGDDELPEGLTLSDELIDLLPEEVLGNLFSLESRNQQEQYWEQYKGKRVEWSGQIYNKEDINGKVAVSLDYACQPSQLSHRNLHAGVIVYLDKSEAGDLSKGQSIIYGGHLYRRLFWDRSEDVRELQFELGYGGASAVTVEDGKLVE